MKRFHIEPEAFNDLKAAVSWYRQIDDELPKRFVRAVRSAIYVARERPASFPFVTSLTRRVLVDRFPYAVLFRDRTEVIIVLGVMHTSMDPDRFLRRAQ